MLSFHYYRHCTQVSFTAMFGMNVFQHCLSSKRSGVSGASVKVLDALCVSACKTGEDRTPTVCANAVHKKKSTEYLPLSV